MKFILFVFILTWFYDLANRITLGLKILSEEKMKSRLLKETTDGYFGAIVYIAYTLVVAAAAIVGMAGYFK